MKGRSKWKSFINNLNKEKRIQRKINEFGTRGPHCALCQQKDINTLITGKLNDLSGKTRSLLEEHHIAGAHQGETIIICRNCHAILTDSQLDWPNNLLDKDRSFLEKAIAFFMGLTNILH